MPKPLEIKIKWNDEEVRDGVRRHAAGTKAMTAATQQSVQEQKIAITQLLTDEEARTIGKNRRVQQSNDAKVDAATKALAKEEMANMSLTERLKAQGSSILENVGLINKVAAAMAAFAVTAKVVGVVTDMWKAQRKDIEESILRVGQYQDKLLELAALKDKLGNTTPVLAETLQFRAQTLQTKDAADTFQQGVLNTSQAAVKGGFIDKDEMKKLAILSGQYQAATNADPNALGNLTGSLPMMIGTQGQKAEDVFRRLIGVFNTLQQGGSSLGQGVMQAQRLGSLIGPGMFQSPEQAAAVQSAYSVMEPEKAATRVEQLIKGTTTALSDKDTAGYLAGLGLKVGDDPVKIAKAVAADLKAQQAANPTGYSDIDYLSKKGYTDAESRQAVINLSKQVNSGQWDQTFGPMGVPGAAPAFNDAVKAQREFAVLDPVAQRRRNDLGSDIVDTARATGSEQYFLELKRQAFNELQAENPAITGDFSGYNNSYMWEGPLRDRSKQILDREAAKVGVKPPELGTDESILGTYFGTPIDWITRMAGMGGVEPGAMGGSAVFRGTYSNKEVADRYYSYANQIRGAKGDPGNQDRLLEAANKTAAGIEAVRQELVKQRSAPGQPTPVPPSQVRPGPPPVMTR